MFDRIRNFFRTIINEKEFTVELYSRVQRGCPSCKRGPMWMEGPHGGACINIYCGHCGEGYNISPMLGVAQKIGKDERYIEVRR